MKLRIALALCTFALTLSLAGCKQHHAKAKLVADPASAALLPPNALSTSFPIRNQSEAPVEGVQVTAIALDGVTATLASPALPLALGDLAADAQVILSAAFSGTEFAAGRTFDIRVAGTFVEDKHTYNFALTRTLHIPPASPGSATSAASSSAPNSVSGGTYPTAEPNFPKEVNEGHAWRVPKGPDRPTAPSKESGVQPAPKGDPPGIDFFTNNSIGGTSNQSTVGEPSGGAKGKIVFETTNWNAHYSTNSGGSFTAINPTNIFPNNVDGGYCCDQIVLYAASIDRILWLMQYGQKNSTGESLYRLAAASPASLKSSNGTSWTYWDFTSTQVGKPTEFLDYPDMSLGDNSLYFSFDEVNSGGRVIVRIPLAEIQSSSTIHWRYTANTDSPMAYGGHLTQSTRDEIFWAGHNNTSSMRVFNWPENSNNYSWRDVNIGSWQNNNLSSTTPDSQDWLTKLQNFPGNAITGSTRVGNPKRRSDQIWFAWTASSGGNFRQAQVQWVALDHNNNYNVVSQQQIWNSSYAFAYPALGVNADGEIGLSLEYGGNKDYENHVAGFWGDYIVYITTNSNIGVTRYGDYVSIRPDSDHPRRFQAYGYGLVKAGGTAQNDTHYIVFGRPGS